MIALFFGANETDLASKKLKKRKVNSDSIRMSFLEQVEADAIQDAGNGESFAGPGLAVSQDGANAAYINCRKKLFYEDL